jgi:hypothetical protein
MDIMQRGKTEQVSIAVMLQNCIPEVLGLNPGQEPGFLDWVFLVIFRRPCTKMLR